MDEEERHSVRSRCITQFVSQEAPRSSEKACSHRAARAVTPDQMKRTRMGHPRDPEGRSRQRCPARRGSAGPPRFRRTRSSPSFPRGDAGACGARPSRIRAGSRTSQRRKADPSTVDRTRSGWVPSSLQRRRGPHGETVGNFGRGSGCGPRALRGRRHRASASGPEQGQETTSGPVQNGRGVAAQ